MQGILQDPTFPQNTINLPPNDPSPPRTHEQPPPPPHSLHHPHQHHHEREPQPQHQHQHQHQHFQQLEHNNLPRDNITSTSVDEQEEQLHALPSSQHQHVREHPHGREHQHEREHPPEQHRYNPLEQKVYHSNTQPHWNDSDDLQILQISKNLQEFHTINVELMTENKSMAAYMTLLENKVQTLPILEHELNEQKLRFSLLETDKATLISTLETIERKNKLGEYQLLTLEKMHHEHQNNPSPNQKFLSYQSELGESSSPVHCSNQHENCSNHNCQTPKHEHKYNLHLNNNEDINYNDQLKNIMMTTFSVSTMEEEKSKKRHSENDANNTYVKRQKVIASPRVNMDLQNIRRRIPERLNSGYVIHAMLFCSLNKLGAQCIVGQGVIEEIHVESYWTLKTYCLFVIKNILRKKASVSCAGNWDKTLRQRWFDGWTQKESFTVVPKPGRKDVVSELLSGHSLLAEDEKRALLAHVQTWSNDDTLGEIPS